MPITGIVAAMALSPLEAALELGDELVEVLKQLNRSENEAGPRPGSRSTSSTTCWVGDLFPPLPPPTWSGLSPCSSGTVRPVPRHPRGPRERGRVVAVRYTITSEGKSYLVSRLRRTGRVD